MLFLVFGLFCLVGTSTRFEIRPACWHKQSCAVRKDNDELKDPVTVELIEDLNCFAFERVTSTTNRYFR